jgi:5'(3')-deoxyribonucleotidase
MSKNIIAIDIDEVVFPMVDSLIEYVDKEHKVTLSADSFLTYRLEDLWPQGSAEGERVFRTYLRQDKLQIAPVKGAKIALERLARKYELVVVTYRDIEVEDVTRSWLLHHFPELFKDLHMLGSEKEGHIYKPKGELCKELGASYLIDDQVANVTSAHEAGVGAILFGDYPWNKADELPSAIKKAQNWEQVLGILL